MASRQPLLTCVISHRASAPARVSVLGIILHQEGKRKPMVACMEKGQERASELSVFSDRWLLIPLRPPTAFRHWESRTSREGDQETWLSQPALQAVPSPTFRFSVYGTVTTLSQVVAEEGEGSVPSHSEHI